MKIFKYPLIDNEIINFTPTDAVFVGMQGDQPCAWIPVLEGEEVSGILHMIGTGWEFDKDWYFIGTTQDDLYVWHWFVELT